MRDECGHGTLRRKCPICERDEEIDELRAEVARLTAALCECDDQFAVVPTVRAYRRLAEACAVAELEDAEGRRFWRLRDHGYTDDIPHDRFKSIESMAQFYNYKVSTINEEKRHD